MSIPITFCKDCQLLIDMSFSTHEPQGEKEAIPGACPRCGGRRLGVTKEEKASWGRLLSYDVLKGTLDVCFWGLGVQ